MVDDHAVLSILLALDVVSHPRAEVGAHNAGISLGDHKLFELLRFYSNPWR